MKEPAVTKETTKEKDGALTDANIQAWKKKHGKIFRTIVDGEEFVWRKLKRKEYVEVMSGFDDESEEDEIVLNARVYRRQESIVKKAVLYPKDISAKIEGSAGLATSLADEIILRSGFDVKETEEL